MNVVSKPSSFMSHTQGSEGREGEKKNNKIEKQGDTFYLVSSIESGDRFGAVKLRYLC